ncbi:MAG: hypothetical protein UT12_C0010G0011 [Candidatus Curtissbacteria bacterium GW2011_GWC2_38_9]|uniref:Aromatic ring hydroxylase n=3 Tax=Candidatus Curtissiibacteriota TaxID=1752717 RepID=A0A1F5HRG7_9BACT|nr:MAG: hypothetical protein UT12_C0010G0011 [Candidatus Curtissbacteria bacterium GW2011_GWC2_38_9]KKS04627.1 MAG: hypothetical protein UU56_C0004G0028 [Candidatus Curtissbacteria bacterium GW2011_GWA2_41_24]OGD88506.1 MAG: aromatic ring hydroxylase [Candidatus Curtissbacteria bacterium RIFCSPHIGHO2_02_39_8]OGE06754.1 MAG: aromatic ring hydroxylase [Candidatus Curtissbacteria bacterium RIFCSPLOWO2_02_41_11]
MVTQEQVVEKLKACIDPELGINIVDLGLIYAVNIEDSRVNVLMTMTTPGCPLDSYFVKDITTKVKSLKGVSGVSVEMTFDPPWSSTKMSDESKEFLGFVN